MAIFIIPKHVVADDSQKINNNFLTIASDVWQIIYNEDYSYGGSQYLPPISKTIDCNSYVSWVLYEFGY